MYVYTGSRFEVGSISELSPCTPHRWEIFPVSTCSNALGVGSELGVCEIYIYIYIYVRFRASARGECFEAMHPWGGGRDLWVLLCRRLVGWNRREKAVVVRLTLVLHVHVHLHLRLCL